MSHTTSIKSIKIQSVTALQAAITEMQQAGMKISLVPNATPRAYYANQAGMGQADFVIKLDDAPYDVGLYKTDDGYEARTDFFQGRVERILGAQARSAATAQQAKLGKMYQLYGVHATMEQCRRKGQSVRRVVKADGTIALEVTGNM